MIRLLLVIAAAGLTGASATVPAKSPAAPARPAVTAKKAAATTQPVQVEWVKSYGYYNARQGTMSLIPVARQGTTTSLIPGSGQDGC
jgi:hypothetical protein